MSVLKPRKPRARPAWAGGWRKPPISRMAVDLLGLPGGLPVRHALVDPTRSTQSHVRVPDIDRFEEALPSIANLTGSPILAGNAVQVLQNGDGFFPPLFADIARARQNINFETYVWWKGEICDAGRRRPSPTRPGRGSRSASPSTPRLPPGGRRALRHDEGGGGEDLPLPPLPPERDLALLNNRTHRKIAIFDGKVAYVFGHGIAEEWTGNGQDTKHWRDTGVRLEGPIVNSVQAVFAQNWVDETIRGAGGGEVLPAAAGGDGSGAGAHDGELAARRRLRDGADRQDGDRLRAQTELIIQNPYFIPDEELVDLIANAVKRGVRVRLMIPGQITDSSIVRHAGHKQFQTLLDKGVEIYEFEPTLSHQKIMIIDDLWSLVGSTNFDDRSLDINDEASVGLIDRRIAGRAQGGLRGRPQALQAARRPHLEPARPLAQVRGQRLLPAQRATLRSHDRNLPLAVHSDDRSPSSCWGRCSGTTCASGSSTSACPTSTVSSRPCRRSPA